MSNSTPFELGLYSFGERTLDTQTGLTVSAEQRLKDLLEEIVLADQLGLDVYGIGGHHRPDFVASAPAVVLAAAAGANQTHPPHQRRDRAGYRRPGAGVSGIFHTRSDFWWPRRNHGRARQFFRVVPGLHRRPALRLRRAVCREVGVAAQVVRLRAAVLDGQYRPALRDVGIYPRPAQDELPIWLAVGGTPVSAVRAGQLRLPLALAIIGGLPEQFRGFTDLYRASAAQAGHDPARLRLGINSHGYVAATSQAARDESFPATAAAMSAIGKERGWSEMTRAQYDAASTLRGADFVGDPEEVAEKILYQHQIFNHNRFLMQMSVGTQPHAQIMNSTELYGTRVAPLVRAEVARRQGREVVSA